MPPPAPRQDRLVLQLADAAFPSTGVVAPAALESAAHLGHLGEAGSVARFVREVAWQTGFGSVPAVSEAHAVPSRVAVVDASYDVFVTGVVANRASREQGQSFVATCRESFRNGAIDELGERVRAGELRGHHAPLFGAVAGILGVARGEALSVWLHGVVRSVLAGAVRLGLTGVREAQSIHRDMAPLLAEILGDGQPLAFVELAQAAAWADMGEGEAVGYPARG